MQRTRCVVLWVPVMGTRIRWPHNNTFNVILMFIFKGLVRP